MIWTSAVMSVVYGTLEYDLLPQVIYMARNPKDLVVSYYQFHRSLRTMSYRGTFQEFCRRFMNDKRKNVLLTTYCCLDLLLKPVVLGSSSSGVWLLV